jgi:hypothetical protein
VHTATLLQDGRVLLAGGLDSSGVCHASCELYDRTTDTLIPTGSMTTKRSGHTATLLDDGRVLVAGGLADYQNPTTAFAAALNTAQDTAEIYDPATGVWTPVTQPMSAKRSGHTATKLLDGKVMLVAGITGGSGAVPVFTNKVDLFDPATGSFSPLPNLPLVESPGFGTGRAFHAASLLPNGDVLVTGGTYPGGTGSGEAVSTRECELWNGSAWVLQFPLPVTVAWHNQVTLDNGQVLVSGGLELTAAGITGLPQLLNPKAFAGIHAGATILPATPIGMNPGLPAAPPDQRGAMSVTRLHDGSFLFLGGSKGDSGGPLSSGYVYTPKP